MKIEKIETEKIVSDFNGSKMEEWLMKDEKGCYQGYHREDGPALIYYYKDGTIVEEKWYNKGVFGRPIEEGPARIDYYRNGNIESIEWEGCEPGTPRILISYYKNGNIKYEFKSEYDPNTIHSRIINVKHYEDGTIEKISDSGTFKKYDSKYDMHMNNSYEAEYYENGNIKYERLGINKNCSLDKPIFVEYDINGNILKAKYFLYNVGYITQAQLNKYNKRLQSKTKIKTCDPNKLEILYYLAKKYNYTDKMDQIGALLVANKLTEY